MENCCKHWDVNWLCNKVLQAVHLPTADKILRRSQRLHKHSYWAFPAHPVPVILLCSEPSHLSGSVWQMWVTASDLRPDLVCSSWHWAPSEGVWGEVDRFHRTWSTVRGHTRLPGLGRVTERNCNSDLAGFERCRGLGSGETPRSCLGGFWANVSHTLTHLSCARPMCGTPLIYEVS